MNAKSLFSSRNTLVFLVLCALFLLPSVVSFAADEPMGISDVGQQFLSSDASLDSKQPALITKMAVLAMLAILPFAIMMLTSFLKIVVVLSLLRNAIGVQQSPPNQAINGMALLMTIYVMFPTGLEMYNATSGFINSTNPQELFSTNGAYYVVNVVERAKEPFRGFLIRNMDQKHISYFYDLAYKKFPKDYRDKMTKTDFIVLVPAFVTSQIKAAFEVGVLIYLPFFVIDLVTSNILLAMGMMMLSPLTIALPLKLLLLVMIDGWTLIVQGLVLSYR
ncbi:MAG: type III secretion system export apparatus subunit SctR [Simkaniaceae bacterium]|nr:type III secretion system export apparatus subunit SctR [Simkaniaceae bacterium]MCF7852393.1 type III secretion system export apparatus subunit SctR [Simkaniaceae bacterium]